MSSVNVKRTTSVLFSLRMLRMLMSLVTVSLTAKYFGVSVEKDAWLLVSVMLTSVTLLIWGPINETFRAKFIFIHERQGEQMALRSAASLFTGIVIVTSGIITILAIFASPIAGFAAVDLSNDGISWVLMLLMISLPTLLIEEINNISSSILNAYNIFYLPEIVGTFTMIAYIAILLFLAPSIGIYSMVAGLYLSDIALTVVLLTALHRKKLFIAKWFYRPDFRLVKPFVLYALPFFFPYAVGQFNGFSERWLAGLLGIGNISILDFGRRFTVILQSVISSILTTLMVPMLARSHASGDSYEFNLKFNEHMSVIYGILLLAIPLLFGAAYPLCDFLFHRGAVTTQNIVEIATLCRLYAAAFMCVMIYIIFGNVLLASEKGKPYAFWGVTTQIAVMALNFGLVSSVGLIVFPVSLGIMHLLAGCIMWFKGRMANMSVALRMLKYNGIVIGSSILIYWLCDNLTFDDALPQLSVATAAIIIIALCCSPLIDLNLWNVVRRIKK